MAHTVTLFLPTLDGGGAERSTLNLAIPLQNTGYDVTLLVQRKQGDLATLVPPDIKLLSLDVTRTLKSLLPLATYFKRTCPDFFIANLGHGNIIALLARMISGSKTKIIACQHSMLSVECNRHKKWQYRILPLLYRLFLPFADKIVAVSGAVASDLHKHAGIIPGHITVIPNAVIGPDFDEKMRQPNSHIWFSKETPVLVAVGRLSEEKDFATLLRAFDLVTHLKNLRLVILGDGPLRNDLQQLAETLNIADRVAFAGYQPNPLPFIRDAAMLVVSSRYEGMGNVIVEALACGTPVVSTNCPGGVREILGDGSFGTLVAPGDANALAQAILTALNIPVDKAFLRKRGQEFTFAKTADSYITLFKNLAA